MGAMRVLLQGRSRGTRTGGDSTVMQRWATGLEARGVMVAVATSATPDDLRHVDIVHVINLDRSMLPNTEELATAAVKERRPFVVTPLWWPLRDYVAGLDARTRVLHHLKGFGVARAVHERQLSSLRSISARQAAVLRQASAVCPSGAAEATALQGTFGDLPLRVVHYGADASPARPAQSSAREGVLCVARLDPRKNQLGLIRAAERAGLQLRLIGADDVFPDYARACRAAARGNVAIDGYVSQGELVDAYRASRVHALCGYFELPGLTGLDAAAEGCAIVAPSHGTARDYFGDAASYCTPDIDSIQNALERAHAAGPPPKLAAHVRSTFSWQASADACLATYEEVISGI